MRALLPHMPTMLESTAPAKRDRPRTSTVAPLAAIMPATDATDLVSRAIAILTQETDAWNARRSADLRRAAAR